MYYHLQAVIPSSPIQPEGNIRNVVIVQSKDSSNQARHDFLIAFHKFCKTENDIEAAYHKALAYIKAKYGAIEFEHSINIRK